MTELQLYDPEERCIKCGAHAQLVDTEARQLKAHRVELIPELDGAPEALGVTCWRCGYRWERRPLDQQQCDWTHRSPSRDQRCTLQINHGGSHDFGE
jgi:Zn ribbon nucleic-acid-binding protein